jgi:hypothetical protein
MLFFPKDNMIAQKIKFLVLFTSQINIEWTKAFLVDMALFYKKLKKLKKIGKFFGVYLAP